jgi:enoyl-CoA hydratase
MSGLVDYRLDGGIATITMDDGKVNVMSLAMATELAAALDRAVADRAVVVLSGRPGVFSAGFDLTTVQSGGTDSVAMVRAGFELAYRLLSFPVPVVVACTGHAVAMGAFLLLSGDYRVGASGTYKLMANEVALGITMPRAPIEILRQRLAPAYFHRAVVLAEQFSPDNAVAAGFLDRVVEPAALSDAARAVAETARTLDPDVHAASKRRAHEQSLAALRAAIDADEALLALGGPST